MIVTPRTWSSREPLAIDLFISRRCDELGLSRGGLAGRLGFRNPTKALRRLDDLCEGDLVRTHAVIQALPGALEVPAQTIADALEATRNQLEKAEKARAAAAEAAWRAAFKPHAVILRERTAPHPMFIAAFIGADQLLRVDFDLSASASSFVNQALNGVRTKLKRWSWNNEPEKIRCFGAPIGVVVNYSPDRAVRYNLDGKALEILPRAERIGTAELFVKERRIPLGLLRGSTT